MAWLLPGATFTAIDVWLSVQAVFGLVEPEGVFGRTAGVIFGLLLTTIAVGEPLLRDYWALSHSVRRAVFGLVWALAIVLDLATSIAGAIWYGVMHQPLGSAIEWDRIYVKMEPATTLVFLGLVLLVAWSCRQFGFALRTLLIGRADRHSGLRR